MPANPHGNHNDRFATLIALKDDLKGLENSLIEDGTVAKEGEGRGKLFVGCFKKCRKPAKLKHSYYFC